MVKKRKFSVSNRATYSILAVIIIILAGVFVYAVVPNPGHPVASIEPPASCSSGQFLKWSGTSWICDSSVGGFVGGGTNPGYWNASGTNIYNTNTGNVGIGTNNPLTKLYVNGSIMTNKNFYFQYAPNPNVIIGLGELQTAQNDWPGKTIFGMGLDSSTGKMGILLPPSGTLNLLSTSGTANMDVTGFITSRRNFYLQHSSNPNIIIGLGELQTAKSDWPGKSIYGMGFDSATGSVGILIPSGSTFVVGSESGSVNFNVGGNLIVSGLTGTGNDYVCVSSVGLLYRSNTAC